MNGLKFTRTLSLLRATLPKQQYRFMGQKATAARGGTTARPAEGEVNNTPINYFGSDAALWRAKDTRSGGSDEHLWYQPYVISGSLAIFLLYFCLLREESDIDLKLEGSLYEHVQGLEEVQLSMNYKYNKENGLDNTQVVKRLTELGIDVKLLDGGK
ncbi:uncharacterized protein LOC133338370 [Musca vetustissima]|uniref:uncharacterized protein LOC133338370 n=1 Tax=Musca vetustissima TaxID=27455 RepID=UPI002AB6DF3E|nr:uncharacterized protein LOC133338370 [Musca vetustissima]